MNPIDAKMVLLMHIQANAANVRCGSSTLICSEPLRHFCLPTSLGITC